MSCITKTAHEIARDEISARPGLTYRKALKIGMSIAWRRFKDATRDFERGLVNGFNV
jgi:hypothetical protein